MRLFGLTITASKPQGYVNIEKSERDGKYRFKGIVGDETTVLQRIRGRGQAFESYEECKQAALDGLVNVDWIIE